MSATNTNFYSPFYKVRVLLYILRCLFGFPIKPTNEAYTRFQFSTLWESIRFVMFLSMVLLEYVIMVGLLLIVDGNLKNMAQIKQDCWNNFSTSKIDHIALIVIIFISVISSLVYLLVFKYNTPNINQLCEDIVDIQLNLSTITKENKQDRNNKRSCMSGSAKTIVYGQILSFITSILFGCWAYHILQYIAYDGVFVRYGIYFPLIFPIIYTIETYYRLFGPMTCSAELVCDQIINSITDLFDDWIDALRNRDDEISKKNNDNLSLEINMEASTMESKHEVKSKEFPSSGEKLLNHHSTYQEEILEIGLKLENIIVATNLSTQGLIAVFFASSISVLTTFCFQIVSTLGLNHLGTENIRNVHVSALSFGVMLYLLRFHRLMNSGQRLLMKVKQSKRALENNMIGIKSTSSFSHESNNSLSVLRKRLEVYQYLPPMSPFGIFSLSNKTFYATLATIISYIIILIKLRGADTSKSSNDLSSFNSTTVP